MINECHNFCESSYLNWESLYWLVERAPFGVYIIDADFKIVLANAECRERAFRNIRPLLGSNFNEAMHVLWSSEIAGLIIDSFNHTLTSGESFYSHEYIHPRADTYSVEAYEWELHRIVLPDGTNGVVCYYYDSTQVRKVEQELRKNDPWLRGQKEAFRSSINGASLKVSLDILIDSAIEYFGGDKRASFYLLNSTGTAIKHITGMDEDYAWVAQDFPVGPDAIGCGLAAYLGEPVICENIDLDPSWLPYLSLAHKFGYRATWSFPVQGIDGKVVGTFCMYSRYPCAMTAREMEIATTLTNAAAVIIASHQVAQVQTQAEQALRKSEERQAFLLKLSDTLRVLADPKDIQFQAMHVLGEHLAVVRAQYYEVGPNEEWLISVGGYANGVPPVLDRVYLEGFGAYLKSSFRAGHIIVVNDILADSRLSEEESAAYAARNIRAYLGIPLVKAGRFVATLCIHNATPRIWTEEEILLADETAQRTWAAVERARAEEALREANRHKDEFLALLAHELRNPLAAIRNTGQILLRSNSNPTIVQSSAEILNRQVDHMVRQVDDLLDISRISRGKIELRKENIELVAVVAQAIEAHRSLCDSQGQTLIVSGPSMPIYLYGDPVRLVQAIGNLINNASKFTPSGGRIEIAIERSGERAIVRVKDSGIGIATSELNKIFDMFVQVNSSLERSEDGLGLGLALVKSLVEMHKGTIEARSEGLGCGSEFVIQFPINKGVIEPPELLPANNLQSAQHSHRILIVDDNHDAAASLALLLKVIGYKTAVAHDGLEAIEKLAGFQADVVLLDISMPHINGYEVARRIRAAPSKKQLKLVAVTGLGKAEDRRRSQEAGFDAHLTKPVDLTTLIKVLDEV